MVLVSILSMGRRQTDKHVLAIPTQWVGVFMLSMGRRQTDKHVAAIPTQWVGVFMLSMGLRQTDKHAVAIPTQDKQMNEWGYLCYLWVLDKLTNMLLPFRHKTNK